eukprot:CAMPEP_0178396310 /NCGR_PEP_ID=MMETSP0689_2-20121128/13664_1 /TAXON_ID=160604 /ORGANISM="Amphidinium massartii, Strain CS-259" /LENGTH=50 /DNA_ID=CAMNT_0020016983 /DNA_START=810 /DNA_END=962 /DNA_ORIENTATION=+
MTVVNNVMRPEPPRKAAAPTTAPMPGSGNPVQLLRTASSGRGPPGEKKGV